METVILDNKEYTKASVIAKRFNYTSDYIGQLCRADKVDARLVGRAWYVTLESINEHRSGRHKKSQSVPVTTVKKTKVHNYLSRVDVEPILNKKIVNILRNKDGRNEETPVRYESDENILIPRVEKSPLSKQINIYHADAEELKIRKKKSKPTLFQPEARPEFVLEGKLSISEYPDKEPEELEVEEEGVSDSGKQPIAEITSNNNTKVEKFKPVVPQKVTVKVQKKSDKTILKAQRQLVKRVEVEPKKQNSVSMRRQNPHNHPKSTPLAVVSPRKKIPEVIIQPAQKSSFKVPAVVVLVAIVISAFLGATRLEIQVSQDSYSARLDVQVANLTTLFRGEFIHILKR